MSRQYISETETTKFWKVAASRVREEDDRPVERELLNYLEREDLDSQLLSFQKFLERQTALVEDTLYRLRGAGKAMTSGLYRHLMHVAIYRKNVGLSVNWQQQYLETVIKHSPQLNATVIIPENKSRPSVHTNLSLQDLNQMNFVCRNFGIATEKPKRTKKGALAPGWEDSHILPVSIHGEGETFAEPAPLNRARGAKPVQKKDQVQDE